MMNFIRDNIVKIAIALGVIIILIIILVACGSTGTGVTSSDAGYNDMENRLQNAAIKLVEKNKHLLPKKADQVKKIQLNTLITNNLIHEMHAIEDNNVVCRGYVEITKKYDDQEDYRYTPYIKCGKYYETKTIAQYIIENEEVVTKDEGLYQEVAKVNETKTPTDKETTKEENEEEETEGTSKETEEIYSYYFKGEKLNNYIVLGERIYRIMGITEDNNLKVISTGKTSTGVKWDDRYNAEDDRYSGINDFKKSRLKERLDFIIDNTDSENEEVFFSDTEKEYIVNHDFCVGKRSEDDTNINSGAECQVKDNLRVGLITVQDYYKTSAADNCTEVGEYECNNYNFLYTLKEDGVIFTTLTANKDDTYTYFQIDDGEYEPVKCNTTKYLYPVIYLDKNILYKSGDGSYENPYIVR